MHSFVKILTLICLYAALGAHCEPPYKAIQFKETRNDYLHEELSDLTNRFFSKKDMDWNRVGFYILMNKWKEGSGDGDLVAFIPKDSLVMNSLFVLQMPCSSGGSSMGKCYECVKKNVNEHKDQMYNHCKKRVPITEEFYRLLKKFIDGKKASLDVYVEKPHLEKKPVTKSGEFCFGYSLQIYYQNENKNRTYFSMVPSSCIDDELKKDETIAEYAKLYDYLYSKLPDFDRCRYNDLGNTEEIQKKCGKYF